MRYAQILIIAFAVTMLSGCDWPSDQSRYQLVTATDGKIYRLDNKTGAVHYVTPESMFELNEKTPVLNIGSYYEMQDAEKGKPKFLKYTGNGQFEKSEWAVIKKPSKSDPLGIR